MLTLRAQRNDGQAMPQSRSICMPSDLSDTMESQRPTRFPELAVMALSNLPALGDPALAGGLD